LIRQVRRHRVHVVGEVLPGAADAGNLRLTAELALGADLARHAAHLRGEAVQLVDHRVDGVFELESFAQDVDGDIARHVAACDGGSQVGDVPPLTGQVRRHRVHVVGEVLPRAGDAGNLRLAAELAVGADLARHAAHLRGEPVQLVDHRIDGV